MDCDKFREQVELLVLDALTAPEEQEMELHLAECKQCQATLAQQQAMIDGIRATSPPELPTPAFEFAVRQSVANELRAKPARTQRRRILFGAGAAAAALVAGFIGWKLAAPSHAPTPAGPVPPAEIASGTPAAPTPAAPHAALEKWRYPGAQTMVSSLADAVVVQRGSVYLLSQKDGGSFVAAVDSSNGRLKWQSDTPSIGYLAKAGDRIFCLASGDRQTIDLVALDAASGKTLWTHPAPQSPSLGAPCRPIPLDGDRVCWTLDTAVHLLDSRTGKPLWTHSITGEGLLSSAVAFGDNLYVASGRKLHCLDAASGTEVWSQEFPREMVGYQQRPLLAAAGGRLYLAQARGFSSQVFCLSLDTRDVAWSKAMPPVRHLLASGNELYIRDQRGIRAMDGPTGRPAWVFAAEGCGPATCNDGTLHFVDGNGNGRLVALNCQTGAVTWEIPDVRSCDAFNPVDGTGYIKTSDGVVHALTLASSSRR